MTDFCAAIADYLATRRAMGYKLAAEGRMLGRFATYLAAAGAERLTIAHALSWARQPPNATPAWWAHKLGVVRGFARYLNAVDPATEVPPVGLLPKPNERIVPYIYSDQDVARLLERAGRLRPEHRAHTYQTLVGLVAVTGMRVGEALRLDSDDIDLDQGLLTIRNTKYGKSRQLPLHPSTVTALTAYVNRRDKVRRCRKAVSFFSSSKGTRLNGSKVRAVFRCLVRDAGLKSPPGRRPPRLHDLRHSFAVRSVIGWYREGLDVEPRLPLLSTYLGHVAPSSTYWYLSAVPELLELITDRLDNVRGIER